MNRQYWIGDHDCDLVVWLDIGKIYIHSQVVAAFLPMAPKQRVLQAIQAQSFLAKGVLLVIEYLYQKYNSILNESFMPGKYTLPNIQHCLERVYKTFPLLQSQFCLQSGKINVYWPKLDEKNESVYVYISAVKFLQEFRLESIKPAFARVAFQNDNFTRVFLEQFVLSTEKLFMGHWITLFVCYYDRADIQKRIDSLNAKERKNLDSLYVCLARHGMRIDMLNQVEGDQLAQNKTIAWFKLVKMYPPDTII